MKGAAYKLLVDFQRRTSPFLFAQLILELGTQQLDRITPDTDDEALEHRLNETIETIADSYERRRQRFYAATDARRSGSHSSVSPLR